MENKGKVPQINTEKRFLSLESRLLQQKNLVDRRIFFILPFDQHTRQEQLRVLVFLLSCLSFNDFFVLRTEKIRELGSLANK